MPCVAIEFLSFYEYILSGSSNKPAFVRYTISIYYLNLIFLFGLYFILFLI